MNEESLQEILESMLQIDDSKNYYAFTFTSEESGRVSIWTQTVWVGFADQERMQEIRRPWLVDPHRMAKLWSFLGQPYLVVNSEPHYLLFSFIGGNALVEQSLLQRCDPYLLEPDICVRSGKMGFVSVKSLPELALNRNPTPKQRMRILKRDDYRCRICGRRPADYVDVELHVHHIRPWSKGGITEDENLITLCHTCHKGLEPHEDHSLFDLINPKQATGDTSAEFLRKVHLYREAIWVAYSGLNKASKA